MFAVIIPYSIAFIHIPVFTKRYEFLTIFLQYLNNNCAAYRLGCKIQGSLEINQFFKNFFIWSILFDTCNILKMLP